MYESYYTFFGLFTAVAFVLFLYEKFNKKLMLSITVVLLIINLKGIYDAHFILTKRGEYIKRLVTHGQKLPEKKYLISTNNYPWQIAWVTWAFPFETLLFSSIQHPDSAVTCLVTSDIDQYDSLITKQNIFLGPEWAITWFASNSLDSNYFRLPSSGYRKLNTSQANSLFDESGFTKENVSIVPIHQFYNFDADPFVVVPVKIINRSGKKIPSIADSETPLYLSYHLYNEDGEEVIFDGRRTVLEVDILSEYVQGIFIDLPKHNGVYTVEVDFLTENKRWWGVNSRFKLVVK